MKLRVDIDRWKLELLDRLTVRGTHNEGIAIRAVGTFECLFGQVVEYYRTLFGESGLNSELLRTTTDKPFEKFTLGELIQHLEQNNRTFAAVARQDSEGKILFRDRRVLSGVVKRTLDCISVLRNDLHRNEFAANDNVLRANTKELLNLISTVMADALFQFVAKRSD